MSSVDDDEAGLLGDDDTPTDNEAQATLLRESSYLNDIRHSHSRQNSHGLSSAHSFLPSSLTFSPAAPLSNSIISRQPKTSDLTPHSLPRPGFATLQFTQPKPTTEQFNFANTNTHTNSASTTSHYANFPHPLLSAHTSLSSVNVSLNDFPSSLDDGSHSASASAILSAANSATARLQRPSNHSVRSTHSTSGLRPPLSIHTPTHISPSLQSSSSIPSQPYSAGTTASPHSTNSNFQIPQQQRQLSAPLAPLHVVSPIAAGDMKRTQMRRSSSSDEISVLQMQPAPFESVVSPSSRRSQNRRNSLTSLSNSHPELTLPSSATFNFGSNSSSSSVLNQTFPNAVRFKSAVPNRDAFIELEEKYYMLLAEWNDEKERKLQQERETLRRTMKLFALQQALSQPHQPASRQSTPPARNSPPPGAAIPPPTIAVTAVAPPSTMPRPSTSSFSSSSSPASASAAASLAIDTSVALKFAKKDEENDHDQPSSGRRRPIIHQMPKSANASSSSSANSSVNNTARNGQSKSSRTAAAAATPKSLSASQSGSSSFVGSSRFTSSVEEEEEDTGTAAPAVSVTLTSMSIPMHEDIPTVESGGISFFQEEHSSWHSKNRSASDDDVFAAFDRRQQGTYHS